MSLKPIHSNPDKWSDFRLDSGLTDPASYIKNSSPDKLY